MMGRKLARCLIPLALCILLAGCMDPLRKIQIVSLGKPTRSGDIEIFTVVGTDEKGTKRPVSAEWELAGENGLLIEPSGHAAYVLALAPGSSTLTARKGELVATAEFSVYEPALSKIVMMEGIGATGTILRQGQYCSLFVVGYDQHDREMRVDPDWSVTEELGFFTKLEDTGWRSNVRFDAVNAGTGTITASQEGKSADFSMTVLPVFVIGGK